MNTNSDQSPVLVDIPFVDATQFGALDVARARQVVSKRL